MLHIYIIKYQYMCYKFLKHLNTFIIEAFTYIDHKKIDEMSDVNGSPINIPELECSNTSTQSWT